MTPHRRSSIVAGTLILLATVATLTSTALAPARTGPGYLTGIATHSGAMATSLLLTLIAAGCSVGIAIALYAVLHRTHPTLAVGAIAFRGIEAVFYIVGAVSLMTLVSLATSPPSDTVGERPSRQAISDALVFAHNRAGVAAVSAFVVGAALYYVALYRTRLVPRWLSGSGIAALPLLAAACCLALYRNDPVTGYVALAAPLGVQEIVFGFWLLIKGFTPRGLGEGDSLASGPADRQGFTATHPSTHVGR